MLDLPPPSECNFPQPTPECYTNGCPSGWLGDGNCDDDCNNEECAFDLGDCGGGMSTGDMSPPCATYQALTKESKAYTGDIPESHYSEWWTSTLNVNPGHFDATHSVPTVEWSVS